MPTKSPINKTWLQAAMLVAEGALSEDEIAQRCAVSPRTLRNWKQDTRFQTCVSEYIAAWFQRLSAYGIASKLHRISALNDIWTRAITLLHQRAEDPKMAAVPGGNTGLLIRRIKAVAGKPVAEYETDTGILQAIPNISRMAAQELGQFADKLQWAGPAGGAAHMDLRSLSDEQLETLEQLYDAISGKSGSE